MIQTIPLWRVNFHLYGALLQYSPWQTSKGCSHFLNVGCYLFVKWCLNAGIISKLHQYRFSVWLWTIDRSETQRQLWDAEKVLSIFMRVTLCVLCVWILSEITVTHTVRRVRICWSIFYRGMEDKQQAYYIKVRAKLLQANLFTVEKLLSLLEQEENSSIISWYLLERNTMRKTVFMFSQYIWAPKHLSPRLITSGRELPDSLNPALFNPSYSL